MSILYSFIAIIIFVGFLIFCKRYKYYKLMFTIPGPIGLPLIGMAHKVTKREDILYAFQKYQDMYGPVLFTWLGPLPILVVSEPQIVEDILSSPHCVNKATNYLAADDGVGEGLFSLESSKWNKHRKLLNPAFRHKVLLSFVPIFNEEMNKFITSMDCLVGKGPVNLTHDLQKFSLKTAIRTTMGALEYNGKCRISNNEFMPDCYGCILDMITDMCFAPWLTWSWLRKLLGKDQAYRVAKERINRFITELIEEKLRNGQESSEGNKNTFINLAIKLLKAGELSVQEVVDESNSIVFGAFETTAKVIGHTIMLLAMHPEHQQRAHEEICALLPDLSASEVTYADVQQMVYMDMLLNESMRLLAPVPIVGRQTSDTLRLSNGIVLPKGVQVILNMFYMHRRKDIWGPTAHTFDPEHFLPTNMEDKHAFSFIPFTKGIRNCIGWRYALIAIKISLAKLLRNYRFTTTYALKDLHFVEDITIKFKDTPLIEIHKRMN